MKTTKDPLTDSPNQTIHEAVTSLDVDAMRRLLCTDPKCVIARDPNGAFPLHTFLSNLAHRINVPCFRTSEFEKKNIEIVELLLRNDEHQCAVASKVVSTDIMPPCTLPSVREYTANHSTMPLHLAVATGDIEIIKIIYEAYPLAVSMIDNRGRTPAELAVEMWEDTDDDIIEFLNEERDM